MIWDALPVVNTFASAYQGYLVALEGAVGRGVEGLKARNPRRGMLLGNAAAEFTQRGQVPQLADTMRQVVDQALTLGAAHAGGRVDLELRLGRLEDSAKVIESVARMDFLNAARIIRDQALTYDIAYRTGRHEYALKKALGELGNDGFSQLDRANRRFHSGDLAVGHCRLLAAQCYLDSFLQTAAAAGIERAVLRHPDGDSEVKLAAVDELRPLFHPNTRYELGVPA